MKKNNFHIDCKSQKTRLIGLDLMRVALALLIFMFHSLIHFNCNYYFLNEFVSAGAIAMTGFFMLSGYALYYSYSDKNLITVTEIKPFYIKRAITILPLYFFIAITFTICDFIQGIAHLDEFLVLFPVETLCLQSTFSSLFSYGHNIGTWFISCIVICYAIYPFLQTMISQISNRSRVILLIVLIGILLYAPIVQMFFKLQPIYSNPFYRLLEFTIGILLAQNNCSSIDNKILNLFRNKYMLMFSVVLLVVLISLALHIGIPNNYMLLNWIAIPCFCVMIIALGVIPFSSLKNNRTLAYLSSISFTFFLCQVLPVWTVSGKVCDWIGIDINILKIVVSFLFCVVGAVLIHELVEKPASKLLKEKFL